MGKFRKFFNGFIEDGEKEKWWFSRNWFFVATIVLIVLMTTLHGTVGAAWDVRGGGPGAWNARLNFSFIYHSFFSSLLHLDWMHLVGNMITFVILGMYLERKFGSIKFFVFVLFMAFFSSIASTANSGSPFWTGFSGVNFAIKTFILLDFIAMLVFLYKKKPTRSNLIWGIVAVSWIVITMSVQLEPSFTVRIYPFRNMGHYSGMLAGAMVYLLVALFNIRKPVKKEKIEAVSESGKE